MRAEHPFLRMLRQTELTDSGCWQFSGSWKGAGYGAIKAWGKMVPVHRLSAKWFLDHRDNQHVLHHCDNPRCWNPDHLYLGDHADNMRDMAARKRARSGKQKLTVDQVVEIKEAIGRGERNMHLAERYNVSRPTISSIRHGRYWS